MGLMRLITLSGTKIPKRFDERPRPFYMQILPLYLGLRWPSIKFPDQANVLSKNQLGVPKT